MFRLLKINCQALWSLLAAGINLGTLLQWWALSVEQIAGANLCYLAGMMALRQLYSLTLTSPASPTSPTSPDDTSRTTMQSTSPVTINPAESEPVPRFQQPPL